MLRPRKPNDDVDSQEVQGLLANVDDSLPTDRENGVGDLGDKHKARHLGLLSTALLLANRMIGTAIFAVPSSIIQSVGSVGAALSLWLVGFALSLCGLFVWLELGCMMPRSGGEKVYLETAYPQPVLLATTIFAFHTIFFGFTGLGSVVIAENLLIVFNCTASEWGKRILALGLLAFMGSLHLTSRTWSVRIMNALGILKIIMLIMIILMGVSILLGFVPSVSDPVASFRHPFAGSSTDPYNYTTALFRITWAFQGWSSAAYVLDEVKDPQKTLKLAGVLAVGSVGTLFFLTNVSYFIAATPEEIGKTGLTVVAILLGKVFGTGVGRITAAMAALSAFGGILAALFSMSRVVQEFAKEGIIPAAPLFIGSAKTGPPAAGYILAFASSVAVIVMVPVGDAYSFVVDVSQYAMAIINLFVIIGLFVIRRRTRHIQNPFRVWTIVPVVYLVCQAYMILTPFLAPEKGKGDTSLPYWLAPVVAVGILGAGAMYWWVWRVYVPRRGGFVWRRKEVELTDGTTVVHWEKTLPTLQ